MGDEEDDEQVYTVQYIDASEAPLTWIARAGRAKVTYVNLDVYEGDYNEGKQRHGNGTYTWNSLTPEPEELEEDEEPPPPPPLVKYSGEYRYGQKHGLGSMVYPDGSSYRGQWAYNQRHGRGTYFYKNGDKYSGEWKEGKRHGNGVFVYVKTQSQLVGNFVNGQMVTGKWLLLDGTVYTGNFKNSAPMGNGSFTVPNGNTISGKYQPSLDEEGEPEEDEDGNPIPPQWVATAAPTVSVTSHAELSRPPMPAAPYVPSWTEPSGNVGLRITEVDVEGGWAVIQNVKAEAGEEEEDEPEDDEDAPVKDTSANLKGMALTIESTPGVASQTIVFSDISVAVGGKLRLLSGQAAKAPPTKPPPKEGEEEEEEPEDEEDEDAVPRKEYCVSEESMFGSGFSSIGLSFTDLQGVSQLVWKVTRNEETGVLEHEGKYKPVPPPEPEKPEGEEEEEEEDEDDEE